MKLLPGLALSLGVMGGDLFAAEPARPPGAKPNIILIYSDDHGYADVGAQGVDRDIRTPNLDALAREGVRFVHGYVSAPQCVPSRAGVITGRYQERFGVEDNTKGPLPLAELTIAERLKPAGYVSCQVGKWHLEPPPAKGGDNEAGAHRSVRAIDYFPLAQGFDEYFTGAMNSFVASHDLQGHKLPNAPRTLTDKRFRCVWQTEAALSFVDRHKRDPFFLYLAYFAPHVPLESPEPWFSKTPVNLPKERRQALAMIAAMDEGIGKLREKLAAEGIEKNTLIFFISDNGAPLKKGAWDGSLNLPLVGEKGMLTDGGIRTPFMAVWPGTLPGGRTYDPAVINLDVAATAVALAGLPADEKLDGVNLIPYVQGKVGNKPHPALFWRWRSQAAILAGRWKLIILGKDERYLFDMEAPEELAETHNLIDKFPQVAADLDKQLMAWDGTLPPPGLPRAAVVEDQKFFDEHVIVPARTGVRPPVHPATQAGAGQDEDEGSLGWEGRNCTLAVVDGALHLQPKENAAKPFITRTRLKLSGPVTATLRVRCPAGGGGEISWRTSDQRDFPAGQSVSFKLTAQDPWQQVRVEMPVHGQLIHVRLAFSGKQTPDIAAITLAGADATSSSDWSVEAKRPGR